MQELKLKLKKQEEEHKILEAEKKKKEELKEQQRLEVIREAQAERDRRVQVMSFYSSSSFSSFPPCFSGNLFSVYLYLNHSDNGWDEKCGSTWATSQLLHHHTFKSYWHPDYLWIYHQEKLPFMLSLPNLKYVGRLLFC
jgi:hypothetical protein